MKLLICCAVMVLALAFGPAMAETTDHAAISNLLHSTFDRPEATLRIAQTGHSTTTSLNGCDTKSIRSGGARYREQC